MPGARNRCDIRILLLGEANVGKTTLILSFVSEEFAGTVPPQAEEITIPAEITPERVPTHLVDFSSRNQSRNYLQSEIRKANVICLVCALDDDYSFNQISDYWLPHLRKYQNDRESLIPVVVIGNKSDLVEDSKIEMLQSLMNKFPEIDTCIECSAKTQSNLTEAFWYAQKCVLYPIGPLLAEGKQLTEDCQKALTRIHRLCDTDNDGNLSDKELEAFQEYCFSCPLTSQSLHDVKQLIRDSCHGGVTTSGVTVKGFLHLHLTFIERGRHETLWTILRKFGYDNTLRLSRDFLCPELSMPAGCSTEISQSGQRFLKNLFNKFDRDQDGCLRPSELEDLLSTCPVTNLNEILSDLGVSVETNKAGWVTRHGFMAHWVFTAYFEPKRALEFLAYLGYTYQPRHMLLESYEVMRHGDTTGIRGMLNEQNGGSPVGGKSNLTSSGAPQTVAYIAQMSAEALLRGISVMRNKREDHLKRQTNRTIFYCRVYGARNVGKTHLCQGLLSRSLKGSDGLAIGGLCGRTNKWAITYGIPVYSQGRSLIMREIGEAEGEQMSDAEALSADVACLVYDCTDPESFKYVADIFLKFYRGTRRPCLFVAAKSDQASVPQNFSMDPFEFTAKYGLPDPESFSTLHDVSMKTSDQLLKGQQTGTSSRSSHNHGRRSISSRRSGSVQRSPNANQVEDSSVLSKRIIGTSASGAKDDSIIYPSDGQNGRATPSHRSGRVSVTADEVLLTNLSPVYIHLATMANYPHLKGLQVAHADYGWKMGIAATILAGFGFVVFRMARGHL